MDQTATFPETSGSACRDTLWTRVLPSGKRAPTWHAMEFTAPWERGPKSCKGPKRGWKGRKKMLHDPDGLFKMVKTQNGWIRVDTPKTSSQ
mmetsp:Transcript_32845/g.45907  ORF Transcript_32845/g.45907 Transcript_32845/m.45907 type:complete len:91 (-) Transcript_32845:115-387(-)